MLNFKKSIANLIIFALFFSISGLTAKASFPDVESNNPNYQAIMYLNEKGIIQGYPDGTFKPDKLVNRAEALKIIILPLYQNLQDPESNPFPDVDPSAWFAKYVQKAKDIGVVSGDGVTGDFEGGRSVNLAEFLKMLLLSYNINLDNYKNPSEVIFNDIQDLTSWFVPYIYYATTTNIIHSDNSNNIYPGNALTRGEIAEMTYRLIVNIQGGETQLYLSMAEAEMIKILQYLNDANIDSATSSASKSLEYTEHALSLSPDKSIVKAANKIAQAFNRLVTAYKNVLDKDYTSAEDNASQAWTLANDAANTDGSVTNLAESIKNIAHEMADSARASQEQ
ncbi:S-layer homology domain-containing protein [bacterium]|nr:S-layer homology domain-containing protein [bacterium]